MVFFLQFLPHILCRGTWYRIFCIGMSCAIVNWFNTIILSALCMFRKHKKIKLKGKIKYSRK